MFMLVFQMMVAVVANHEVFSSFTADAAKFANIAFIVWIYFSLPSLDEKIHY